MTPIRTTRRMFAAGEPVFAAGDPADFAYLVEHGRIGIFAADAPHEMLGEIGPGGLFGELAILDSTLRIAGARALVDSELSIISRELFTERLEATDPIVRMLFDTVLNRVRQRDSLNQKAEVPPSKAGVSKMRLELDLRGALESGAIECVFQPIQSLANGRGGHAHQLRKFMHCHPIAATQQEKGCIGYDLHESVTKPGTYVFVERWENRDALTAHMNAEHFKVWRKAGAEGITSRKIEIISDGKVETM